MPPLPLKPPSLFQPFIAILLQLAVISFIIISICVKIYIRQAGLGTLSTSDHILYVTGITVLATLVSTQATGQIRHLWFRKTVLTEECIEASNRKTGRAAAVAGLGSIWDSVKYWPITLSFLVVSLIMTSIVAALTPTMVLGKQPDTQEQIPCGVF